MTDLQGRTANPLDPKAVGTVWIFVTTDCPISNRYAPDIQNLYDRFSKKGFSFFIIYTDRPVVLERLRRHMQEYRYTLPALADPNHLLAKKSGVTVTPGAAVYSRGGTLLYRGRIDDRYFDLGHERPDPTHKDVEEVLQNLAQGKSVSFRETEAVGCDISSP